MASTFRRAGSVAARVIKRWRVPFAACSVAVYALALVVVVVVFPDVSNLWVSVFVLVSGFIAGMATLADLLVNAEEAER